MAEQDDVEDVEASDGGDLEADGSTTSAAERIGERFGALLAIVLVIGAVVLVVVGLLAIVPPTAPNPKDPSFIDSIFANRFVIFTARLILLAGAVVAAFAATYVIVSIVSWMRRGHWLRRAGPFEVSEQAISSLQEQIDLWRQLAQGAEEEVENLKERLSDTEEVAEELFERLQSAEDENARLTRELGERSS